MKVSALKENPDNPRTITKEKFEKLKKSIREFPRMMELRPIVVDADGVVLGGNMRLRAVKALGMKDIPDSWVVKAEDLTPEQRREFIVKDNAGFGDWDMDALANEWADEPLGDWGVDLPEEKDDKARKDLSDEIELHYKLEVDCVDQDEQEALYNELTGRGLSCNILTL